MSGAEIWEISGGLKLLLQISRLFGSAPVTFHSNGGTFVRLCPPLKFYGFILGCSVTALNIYIIYKSLNAELKNDEIIYFPTPLSVRYYIVSTVCVRVFPLVIASIFWDSRIKTLLACFSQIRQIKETINGSNMNIKKWKVNFLFFSCLSGMLLTMSLDIWIARTSVLEHLFIFLSYTSWLTLRLQFCVLVLYTNSAFQDINNSLELVLTQIGDESIQNEEKARLSSLVRQLSEAFASTCTVVKTIIKTESIYLFFHIIFTTLYLTETLYSIVDVYQLITDHLKTRLAMQLTWWILHILIIMLILEPCHRAHEEVTSTRLLIGKLMCHSNFMGKLFSDVTTAFHKQLVLSDLSYSALGILTLDRSLLSAVISAVTTVFLILRNMDSFWYKE